MTRDIAALCDAQGWQPAMIVGHSAGGALALNLAARLAESGTTPRCVVGINAALSRFEGVAGWLFPLMAKTLAINPVTAALFAAGRPNPARARRLIESTGSRLDAAGIDLYARLLADRAHVDGTLQMMARWDVDTLARRLPTLGARCVFLVGENDAAVPPSASRKAAATIPSARVVEMPRLGHLAHEEDPQSISRIGKCQRGCC